MPFKDICILDMLRILADMVYGVKAFCLPDIVEIKDIYAYAFLDIGVFLVNSYLFHEHF